jgi:hypothetical protein
MIRMLENCISDGVNVDECKRALRELLRNCAATASLKYGPVKTVVECSLLTVTSQEVPAAPLTLEQERLRQLYDPETTKLYDDEDMKNYHAVVRDYEANAITHPPPGKVYFYYKGFKVTGQVNPATTRLDEEVKRLVEEHGIGKIWAEGVSMHSFNQLASEHPLMPNYRAWSRCVCRWPPQVASLLTIRFTSAWSELHCSKCTLR